MNSRYLQNWARWAALICGACALLPPTLVTAQSLEAPTTQPVTERSTADTLNNALIIPIRDAITEITFDSVERRLKPLDEQGGFDVVIFEMDTPGGVLTTTLDICKRIKRLRASGIKTYAWINDDAYSAGTIIALATNGIIMTTTATIGDCQPIMISGGAPMAVDESIEAKATSPLQEELEDSAHLGGYNSDMLLALIRPEMVMFWVENTVTNERRFATARQRNVLFGLDDGNGGILSGLFGSNRSTDSYTEPIPDSKSQTDWKYVTHAEGLGDIKQPILDESKLLTMKTRKATAYGFNLATVDTDAELRSFLNLTGTITRMENTPLETAIEWLASPMIRSILFLIMVMGAYAEFKAPGFGLPGAVSIIALILFLGAPYMAGITVTWEIIAIFLGILLLAVEAFLIPGFGVAGVTGIILLMVGLLWSFIPPEFDSSPWVPTIPTMPMTFEYMKKGLYSLLFGMSGSLVGMVLLAKYFKKLPIAGRIIADNPIHDAIQMDDPYDGVARVGDIGQTESLLRPAGKARFGAILVDVLSEGEYIQKGTRVEVVERAGNRVVVRRAD